MPTSDRPGLGLEGVFPLHLSGHPTYTLTKTLPLESYHYRLALYATKILSAT